jgi:hypothetical protein
MYCTKCDAFFQPAPEEEKLITTGGLPVLCLACEKERWKAKAPAEERVPIFPGMEPVIGTGIELYRAARFSSNGVELLFVALPTKPRKETGSPFRKERPQEAGAHVFVMSESTGQLSTIPRVQLVTNLKTYTKYKSPLKITKIPDCWDPFTGVGDIVIDQEEIVTVSKKENIVQVDLKDGGWVHLYYR